MCCLYRERRNIWTSSARYGWKCSAVSTPRTLHSVSGRRRKKAWCLPRWNRRTDSEDWDGRLCRRDTGIYFSILLKPQIANQEVTLLTTIAAVAVCEAIEKYTGKMQIKWVNDIFIDSHKVCGILTQAAFQMENLDPEYVIVGIGINLYMPTEGFGKELENIAGSVLQEQSGDIKNKILAETLNRYFYYYKNFAKKEFIAEYKKRSLVLGKGIRVVTKDGERKATALDIDDMCHLLVEYEDGTRENLSTGEISIRLQ